MLQLSSIISRFKLSFLVKILVFCPFILIIEKVSFARPEYATKEKLNCVACHVTPWGGGPRNIFGKAYGSRGLGIGKLSTTDLIYSDIRFIDYVPTSSQTNSVGLALMEAAVTGNVPVIESSDKSEMRALLTYNIAPLSGANVREAYIRWKNAESEDSNLPTNFIFGRFYVPFGLLTDEHRTYTRLQTNMTYNNYSVGAAISANISSDIHYDFALVNDFQTGGVFTNRDHTWGIVANFRWNPQTLPILFGVSANFQHTTQSPYPYAGSFYGVLSLDRLTSGHISGSLQFERVDAKNWNNPLVNTGLINPGLPQFFIPTSDSAYLSFISNSSSIGYYGLAKYNLSSQWTLFYKFDFLALDRNYLDDAYFRHGIGFESYLNSNLILNIRFEKAAGMRPEIASSDVLAAQDDIFAMLRIWL